MAVSLGLIWAAVTIDPAQGGTRGQASWYGFESGKYTANGERFRPNGISCASRSLAFNTRVRVTDLHTGRSVICRISDRGPALRTHRIIDLSRGAAAVLGIIRQGVAMVSITIVR